MLFRSIWVSPRDYTDVKRHQRWRMVGRKVEWEPIPPLDAHLRAPTIEKLAALDAEPSQAGTQSFLKLSGTTKTGITDRSAQYLKQFDKLQYLSLCGTKIGNETLQQIKGLKELHELPSLQMLEAKNPCGPGGPNLTVAETMWAGRYQPIATKKDVLILQMQS